MYWCTRWVWETSLAALLLALIFWLTLDLEERDGLVPWIQFGLLWGIAALANTSLLAFLPASGLWAWYRRWQARQVVHWPALCCRRWYLSPASRPGWHGTTGLWELMSLRSNFGAELRIGNGPGADGTWREYLHPTQNVYEMRRYRQLGEIAYVAERKREAVAFIREDYPRFRPLRKALHLLLGRSSAIVGDRGVGSHQEFDFPGFLGTCFLGAGPRLAQAEARRLVVFMADPVLSGGVLLCFPASTLSPSH